MGETPQNTNDIKFIFISSIIYKVKIIKIQWFVEKIKLNNDYLTINSISWIKLLNSQNNKKIKLSWKISYIGSSIRKKL